MADSERRARLPRAAHTFLGVLAVAALAGPGGPAAGGEGPAAAAPLWDEIETEDSQTSLGLFTHKDQRWVLARLTDVGRAKLAQRANLRGLALAAEGSSVLVSVSGMDSHSLWLSSRLVR